MSDFIVNIGICPKLNIGEDIKMIKSMLLYADKINVYNPIFDVCIEMTKLNEGSKFNKILFLQQLLPFFDELNNSNNDYKPFEEMLYYYNYLNNKKVRNNQEIIAFLKIKKMIEEIDTSTFQDMINTLINNFDNTEELKQIIKLNKEGYLKIKPTLKYEGLEDKSIENFVNTIKLNLVNKKEYSLFDYQTSDIISSMLKQDLNNLSKYINEKQKSVALASNILKDLPNFETIPLDELIDIKTELNKYLSNFRKAIKFYSKEIECKVWDEDFYYYCNDIIEDEIKPSIEELKEMANSNNILNNLLGTTKTEFITNAVGSLSYIGMIMFNPSQFETLTLSLLGLKGLDIISKTIKNTKDLKKNQLYFYYETQNKMSNNSNSSIILI